ncbi:hypothetical protein Tco_0257720 [Tanacetum coccineum]
MLGKGTDFSEESVKKSWWKESANERGSKFIPRFDSSFVEFVQPCFCFSNSEEFMNVYYGIGFGCLPSNKFPLDERQVLLNGTFVCGFRTVIAGTRIRAITLSAAHKGSSSMDRNFKDIKKMTEVIDV